MKSHRLCPDRPFPAYRFRPGQHPHPHKDGGHGLGKDLEARPLVLGDVGDLVRSPDYLFGLDLFNHGYFWEAHVYWEALWNAFGRQGRDAWGLQGLIKMAAAGIKYAGGQDSAAQGHLLRAQELFQEAQGEGGGDLWAGLSLNGLLQACEEALQGPTQLEGIKLEPQI